jgi:hypothetical protein
MDMAPGRWALAACWLGRSGMDRVEPSGSAQEDRLGFPFFLKLLFNVQTIPDNLVIVLKHQKYSENSKNLRKIPRDTLGHEQSK